MGCVIPPGIPGSHIPDATGNHSSGNSTAFKSGEMTFSELLSETIKKASQPTDALGVANPPQMYSSIVNTGNPLDMAIEGEGYFVLNDGSQNLYTRSGAFAVNAKFNLIDPATGYIAQRTGSVGEADRFQEVSNSNINIPYGTGLRASATSSVTVAGNLGAAQRLVGGAQTNVLSSNIGFTIGNGANTALAATKISDLDQYSGTWADGTLTFSGYKPDGSALGSNATGDLTMAVTSTTTLQDMLDYLNIGDGIGAEAFGVLGDNATAALSNGKITITDTAAGYSKSDFKMAWSDTNLTMPAYFELTTVGGEEVKNVNITVFDSQGGKHILSGAFVRTDTANTWDMILSSISGNVSDITFANRRINDLEFYANSGSFKGLNAAAGDTSQFTVTFAHDTANPQTIGVSMGTAGQFNGLTQFDANSTAVAREQDGYEASSLSTVSVNNEGILIGAFSNGIKKNIAALQIALFQNTSGPKNIGNNYFTSSSDSGETVATQAMIGGAGTVWGGSLEKSSADVATEFVNMIQAQSGFQANAKTIQVANNILGELSSFIS